jgi:hypothetical protein
VFDAHLIEAVRYDFWNLLCVFAVEYRCDPQVEVGPSEVLDGVERALKCPWKPAKSIVSLWANTIEANYERHVNAD